MTTTKLTDNETRILEALRQNVETHAINQDGRKWGTVYLDNACPRDMNPHQFAGTLSALERKGLYRQIDDEGLFGDVLIARAE